MRWSTPTGHSDRINRVLQRPSTSPKPNYRPVFRPCSFHYPRRNRDEASSFWRRPQAPLTARCFRWSTAATAPGRSAMVTHRRQHPSPHVVFRLRCRTRPKWLRTSRIRVARRRPHHAATTDPPHVQRHTTAGVVKHQPQRNTTVHSVVECHGHGRVARPCQSEPLR